MKEATKPRDVLLLLGWALLPGALLAGLSAPLLASLPFLEHHELAKIALSSLLCFALPSLLFPVGKEARQAFFRLPPRGSITWRSMGLLLGVSLLSLGLGALSYEVSLQLAQLCGYTEGDLVSEQVKRLLTSGQSSPFVVWFTLALLPAFTEELYFRGMLQPLLTRLLPWTQRPWLPLLVTALLFSLLHFSPIGFGSRLILGYALSYLAAQTQGLQAPFLLHLLNNTLALLTLH